MPEALVLERDPPTVWYPWCQTPRATSQSCRRRRLWGTVFFDNTVFMYNFLYSIFLVLNSSIVCKLTYPWRYSHGSVDYCKSVLVWKLTCACDIPVPFNIRTGAKNGDQVGVKS